MNLLYYSGVTREQNFRKVFLEIDSALRTDSGLFGEEWDEVKKQQVGFLLERPVMFKELSEKYWGPQKLVTLWTDEWWETEQGLRKLDKDQIVEELADMTLLLLTQDSLNPNLSLPGHISLLEMMWNGTVKSYCEEIGLDRKDLIPTVEKKIKINKARNPKEAFVLVVGENMQTSKERMDKNWMILKKKRDSVGNKFKRNDWWKQWLYVDDRGWLREKNDSVAQCY